MAMLTTQERVAFTLRHHEWKSIDDIGEVLGIQHSAAKHAVFRAVRKLRAALEPLRREA
jgi:RNA polymerase sigma-70 factor (ECF subfamily)